MKQKTSKFILWIGGLAVGLVNGLLGAGGGMLAVPLLKKSGLSRHEAHANSVALILPLSIFSAVMYLISDRVKLLDALPYIPGGIVGALLGAWVLKHIPNYWLKKIFAVFMVWAGIRLLTK